MILLRGLVRNRVEEARKALEAGTLIIRHREGRPGCPPALQTAVKGYFGHGCAIPYV